MDSIEITLARIEERVNTVLSNQSTMVMHVEKACALIAANETKIAVNTNRLDRIEPRVLNVRAFNHRAPRSGWYVPRWAILAGACLIVLALAGALSLDLTKAQRVVAVAKDALPLVK